MSPYCKVEKIRLVIDDPRWKNCDARDSDQTGGVKGTCSVCTGYDCDIKQEEKT